LSSYKGGSVIDLIERTGQEIRAPIARDNLKKDCYHLKYGRPDFPYFNKGIDYPHPAISGDLIIQIQTHATALISIVTVVVAT